MSHTIDVYRGPQREPFGPVPLLELLDAAMVNILGLGLGAARVQLVLLPVPDDDPPGGPPVVRNMTPRIGWARVTVHDGGRVLYQHPHTIEELIARPLREALAEAHPEEAEWAFAFTGLDLAEHGVTVPEPEVEGATTVVPYAEGEEAPFRIRRIEEKLPPARLADFGIDPGPAAGAAAKVLVAGAVREELLRGCVLSSEVEEGGFLVGHVFADQEAPGTHIVQVTGAPPAEHTGASLLHLTFTGDSFAAIKRQLRGGTEKLVGWYHTHLFAAAEEMGLSTIDLRLHFTTFKLPWQLAGLVNLDGRRRALRFYVRRGDEMELCPQWAVK